MKYFNGFSLSGEEKFFAPFLNKSDFSIAGFSYGAQVAFETVYQSRERIEKLILLSPAFFQSEKKSFVRTQLRYFDQDRDAYTQQFLNNVIYPAKVDLSPCLSAGKREDLEALLTYRWDEKKIIEVLDRGTQIEVYFGEDDKIIQSDQAFDFFSEFTTAHLIKSAGHLLQL